MKTKNEKIDFVSAIKYAFSLRFGAPYSPKDVPTIGVVFGSHQLAAQCQEYIGHTYENDQLIITITPGLVTAKVELKETVNNKTVLIVELNYDGPELLNFQDKTPPDSRAALIFGFKHSCDYYVTGNTKDEAKDFSPIVLSGFTINQ